jgi:hypothetical protein
LEIHYADGNRKPYMVRTVDRFDTSTRGTKDSFNEATLAAVRMLNPRRGSSVRKADFHQNEVGQFLMTRTGFAASNDRYSAKLRPAYINFDDDDDDFLGRLFEQWAFTNTTQLWRDEFSFIACGGNPILCAACLGTCQLLAADARQSCDAYTDPIQAEQCRIEVGRDQLICGIICL